MQVTFDPSRDVFVWRGRFEQRGVPEQAGFQWEGSRWVAYSVEVALRLAPYLNEEARAAIAYKQARIAASRAADSDLEVPTPAGCELAAYQKAGIDYALGAYARGQAGVIIGDEMGLGKTVQALGFVNALRLTNVLVICPASLKINWQREADRWLADPFLSVGVADPKRGLPDDDMVVCNYDILGRLPLRERQWDVIIVDEAHLIKNPDAQRTRETLAIPTPFRLFLTGTPVLNRPVELWPLLHACAPEVWGDYGAFVGKYCGAHMRRIGRKTVLDVRGASNLGELRERLRGTVMVRRSKRDVLHQLPEKRHEVLVLPRDGAETLLREESRLWARLTPEEAAQALDAGKTPSLEGLAEVRRKLGEAKVRPALEYIRGCLEGEGKLVIFAVHRAVLEALRAALPGAAMVHGGTPLAVRQEAVDRFQRDPQVRVFLGQIQAAGVGLTLTASSHAIFVEQSWSPSEMQQAEDRIHRRGQSRGVLITRVVFDLSLDALLFKISAKKSRVLEKVVG